MNSKGFLFILVLLAGFGFFFWQRQKKQPTVSAIQELQPVTETPSQEMPPTPQVPTIVAPPKEKVNTPDVPDSGKQIALAPIEPTPKEVEPPDTEALNARVRECMQLQARIKVPHSPAEFLGTEDEMFSGMTVIRLEPDGLHVQHSTGIHKIEYGKLSEEWQRSYYIDPTAANWYRKVLLERQRALAAEQAHVAAVEQAELSSRVQQRDRDQAASAAEQERNKNMLAWQQYEIAMTDYRQRLSKWEDDRYYARRNGRVFAGARPHQPRTPSVPRPAGKR